MNSRFFPASRIPDDEKVTLVITEGHIKQGLSHARPIPVASRVGRGFVPVIFHPDNGPERFPRKAKATLAEALEYARRTIHYRRVRENEKGRHIEALSHPRFATWAEYQAATPEQQRASWDAIMASWQRNYERELDADVAFDHLPERRQMWEACE